jgi:hypothetical protein
LPIKPVDFQVMIPRTLEAAKVSNDLAQKNHLLQQQQAAATQQKADDSLRQVYARQQAEHVHITEKQRDNSRNEKDKKKKGKNGRKSNEAENDRLNKEIKTSTIDIKI